MNMIKRVLTGAAVGAALLAGGLTPAAQAAPVAAAPVAVQQGMGAGAYAYWCGWFGKGCRYKTFYDRTGTYTLRCADLYCTRFF